MLSHTSERYLESVLGLSMDHLRRLRSVRLPKPVPLAEVHHTGVPVVLTPELNPAERALLQKIVASVELLNFQHVEKLDLPETLAAPHVLEFSLRRPAGRSTGATGVHWQLPPLADMTGASPEVVQLKKLTWNLLQQFAKELK